ncbi:HWE histidine kinase domain-containing protein [Rhodopseudomonas sp.]|uniref:HWE histidine kinase domain-containing protein n=1 Tax=Rhodopseudomonas sp. TaxID=1078 RepID=UPI0025CD9BF8|nr:HWE histidine kinase domain-containing protein [Rhodopseudomonas sp.]
MDDQTALLNCESEEIHLLGGIQPIGFLLTVNADWIVLRASENVSDYLKRPHDQIVGHPVKTILPVDLLHDIGGRLQSVSGTATVGRLFRRSLGPDDALFDIAAHFSGPEIVLEFERSAGDPGSPLPVLRAMMARVQRNQTPQALYNEAARQIQALTGFERVMIYRFDADGSGEVVAECAESGLPSYLGHHYPASDIPAQARALYQRNYIRLIEDSHAAPVPVTPQVLPDGARLDMSMCDLRSVSPVHLEYLRNMGVRASMSISILVDGGLWGLIVCHDREPRDIGVEMRSTAELFGQFFSSHLESQQRRADSVYEERARQIHDQVAAAFAAPGASLGNLPAFLAGVSDYVPSDGIGIYYGGEISLSGTTPTREEFFQIVKFLNKTAAGKVFATHCLEEQFPPAADYPMRAAGLLSIPISRLPRDYLVFFRREIAKTVTWAGEPGKIETTGPSGVRLTPRKSFEAWCEIVHGQSRHWEKREIRAAEALRLTLIELVLRLSEFTESERASAQRNQEILIAELNHRVRNILGLVRGLITQSAASATDVSSLVESLDQRIQSLARAHDFLSTVGWQPLSLRQLLRAELSEGEGRLTLTGPDVTLQSSACTPLTLVIHELVTNTRKYGALSKPGGGIRVETSADAVGNVSVIWQEFGGPPVTRPVRRGFGTTMLEKMIPFELRGSSVLHYLPSGFRLELVLPAAVAECVVAPTPPTSSAETAGTAESKPLTGACMLVEDNLFIAADAGDMLQSLGADPVIVVKSVAEAIEAMAAHEFRFALLDVNLGSETSMPVASELRAANIPFAFGTGYGLALPEPFKDAPVVAKPYHREALLKAIRATQPTRSGAQKDQRQG